MSPRKALSYVILACIVSACSIWKQPEPTVVPTPTLPPIPEIPPTPAQNLAVLVLPADMEKSASDAYQKVVYDLAQQAGMRFQLRNTFTAADMEPGLRIVITLAPDPGIASLAAAAPNVQFLAINIPGVNPGGNVSALASNTQIDIPAFVAGYTAALISDDYRVGMVLPKDNPQALQAARAFANGMAYYCGLCNSFRLYIDQTGIAIRFPQFIQIPPDEDPSKFGGWANYVAGSLKVDAVYVYPDPKLAVTQFYDALGQTGAQIIGASAPERKPAGWVMEIRPDEVLAIQGAWPGLLQGLGGQSVPSPLGLADVDPVLLSPGKLRLVQGVLDALQAGRITTGVSP